MEFTNKCCCPNKCSGSSGGSTGSLSFGSILLIIGFSMVAIYFIGGFVYFLFGSAKVEEWAQVEEKD